MELPSSMAKPFALAFYTQEVINMQLPTQYWQEGVLFKQWRLPTRGYIFLTQYQNLKSNIQGIYNNQDGELIEGELLKAIMNIFYIFMSIYSLQVIIEGIAGISYASSIAVDDLGFSKNLTCTSVGKPTSPTIFKGNAIASLNICKIVVREVLSPVSESILKYRPYEFSSLI